MSKIKNLAQRLKFLHFNYSDPTHENLKDRFNDIRIQVFVKEQLCTMEMEFDGLDEDSLHVLMQYQNDNGDFVDVGIARILKRLKDYEGEKVAKFGRIAITENFRRKGLATELVKYCQEFIEKEKEIFPVNKIALSVQCYTRDLYFNLGYKPVGEMYIEDMIEHELCIREHQNTTMKNP